MLEWTKTLSANSLTDDQLIREIVNGKDVSLNWGLGETLTLPPNSQSILKIEKDFFSQKVNLLLKVLFLF